jgi:hypothetical protein
MKSKFGEAAHESGRQTEIPRGRDAAIDDLEHH